MHVDASSQAGGATLASCSLLQLPSYPDERGELLAVERSSPLLPFAVERVYFISGVPPECTRAQHAHRVEHEVMCALTGSLTVRIDDGLSRQDVVLAAGGRALHVPPGIWHALGGFTPGSVCAVFSSTAYDPADYIHDYRDFLSGRGGA